MIDKISHSKCTGCKMCADKCPFSAISFKSDERGFWFPFVDYDKCKNCSVCLKSCPALNNELQLSDKLELPNVFEIWSKDDQTRIDSTSGGIFWEFGKYIIENGGFVIGSVYSDDWKSAYHYVGENLNDLSFLKGSKYFQSDTAGIYNKLKECLDIGKTILFVGSPCQIAAVKSFLGKEYENLYLMDFICRGINSPLAFKKFIDCLEEKYHSKVTYVQLKNKRTGWQSLGTLVRFENGEEYHQDKWRNDIWVKGFLEKNLYMRESCHNCKYRNIPHGADITLGDFWGVNCNNDKDLFYGISSMMINSLKGKKLYELISSRFVAKEKYLSELLPGNPALLENPPKASEPEKTHFFKLLEEKGFENAVNSIKRKKISFCRRSLNISKNIIRKLFHVVSFAKNYDLLLFLKLNFFKKNVIRDKGIFVLPKRNSIVFIDKTAKLILKGQNLNIGVNKTKHSRGETIVKLEKNSCWECNNGGDLFFGTNLELKPNSNFKTGYFSMNSGSSIICAKEIELGNDVMMGRNIIIYDSDFHQMLDEHGFIVNPPKKVNIQDHVWLVNNIVVLKGVTIGKNSLITSFLTVKKDVPENSVVSNGTKQIIHEFRGSWNRDTVR